MHRQHLIRELQRQLDGLEQAVGVRLAKAGDVERGAVVDGVRTIGKPSVVFTASSKQSALSGMCPWSWYMQTNRSVSRRLAGRNAVSGGTGPSTLRPSFRADSIAGMMATCSSVPNSPFSPA